MRKRVKIALAVMFVAVVGFVAWEGLRAKEPMYQGKSLSTWIQKGWLDPRTDSQAAAETEAAVKAMGTNTILFFLKLLRAKETPWSRFVGLLQKLHLFKIKYIPARTWNGCGVMGFHSLGPSASNAVPALIGILEEKRSPDSQCATVHSLRALGPAARSAGPALLCCAGITNDVQVRELALSALCGVHAEGAPRAVIAAAHDTNSTIRQTAALCLPGSGANTGLVTATLKDLLKDQDSSVRGWAARAVAIRDHLDAPIQQVHDPDAIMALAFVIRVELLGVDAATSVPRWTEQLNDQEKIVRAAAARGLLRINPSGPTADSALRVLTGLLNDEDSDAKGFAIQTLRALDPVVAAKAGVNTNAPGK